ncbi:type III effector protein [Streptomyces sp. NPDC059740]|uniref:type III effector protein n=1 Tax=Streptomyces sp. NPDC059740 TaxID=3346926 RepID=UPI003646474E
MTGETTGERGPSSGPASFAATVAALGEIEEAVRTAETEPAGGRGVSPCPEEAARALEALALLRTVRDRLAGWESGLIETAREAGASWADLAHPLGVASRQAAERRYLRLRPGAPGTTGEQRVQATRDRRAADRTVTVWARDNAADLRQLAGQVAALTDLPAEARAPLSRLVAALADNDPASLVTPLTETRPHLAPHHPALAARIASLTRHTDRLRRDTGDRRTS